MRHFEKLRLNTPESGVVVALRAVADGAPVRDFVAERVLDMVGVMALRDCDGARGCAARVVLLFDLG